jgi:hypothetical protein
MFNYNQLASEFSRFDYYVNASSELLVKTLRQLERRDGADVKDIAHQKLGSSLAAHD